MRKFVNLFIVSFIGFLLLLILKHYSDEIRYQEALHKYYIQDSLVLELENGFTMTIYKQDSIKDESNEDINSPTATLIGNTDK
jgi:hypothetical protein